jgi:hypothetical protein
MREYRISAPVGFYLGLLVLGGCAAQPNESAS